MHPGSEKHRNCHSTKRSLGFSTTKPNFEAMTREELRSYILKHREDDEALAALLSCRDPNAPGYSNDLSSEEMTEILKRKIAGEI